MKKRKPTRPTPTPSAKPYTPHDDYIRSVGKCITFARQLFQFALSADMARRLDWSTLQLAPDSFLDANMKEHLSDLVYTSKMDSGSDCRICLLLEHKSYNPGRKIFPQVGRYLCSIQEEDIRQAREPFTLTIPILLYHGDTPLKWKAISDCYGNVPEELAAYALQFGILIVNLHEMTDAQIFAIGRNVVIRNIFLALKHAGDDDFVRQFFEEICTFVAEKADEEELRWLFEYTFKYLQRISFIQKEEYMEIAASISQPLGALVKTSYEQSVEEGFVKGVEKGIEQSLRTHIRSILLKMPDWSNEKIADLLETDVKLVARIRKEIRSGQAKA
jgi:hypothetical protein